VSGGSLNYLHDGTSQEVLCLDLYRPGITFRLSTFIVGGSGEGPGFEERLHERD
jgi:hypothetical protein